LPQGLVRAMDLQGDVHTLRHPRLGERAARAFFAGAFGQLPPTATAKLAAVGRDNSLVGLLAASGEGGLSEGDWRDFVRETCSHRPLQCVGLLAWWTSEVPESPARRRIVRSLRRHPYLSDAMRWDAVAPLAALFAGRVPRFEAGDPVAAVRALAQRVQEHRHPAAPFPARGLERAWRLCEADPALGSRCRAARAEVELGFRPRG
jgi:hypothetical protein